MRSHFLRGSFDQRLVYVGGTGNAVAQSANYTIDLSSLSGGIGQLQANDIIVICNGVTSSSTNTNADGVITSGFTTIGRVDSSDTRATSMWVSYKKAVGNEGTITVRGNGTGATYGNAAVAHVWRNIDLTTQLDVTTTTASGVNSGRPNAPSITPVTKGAIILGCGYGSLGTTTTALTSGLSNVATAQIGATNGGGAAIIAAYTAWTSGAYDMAAFAGGSNTTSDSWCARAVVLRQK